MTLISTQKSRPPDPTLARRTPGKALYRRVYVWQPAIRIYHWVTAASITALFVTGFMITHPIVTSSPFSPLSMGRMRQVHFAAGYVFLISVLWRVYWFFLGNEFARSGFPYVWRWSWWREVVSQARDYLVFDFGSPHLGHNALAGLSYVAAIFGLGTFQIVTGFALLGQSHPDGLWDRTFGWVIPLLGGSLRTHMWHDLAAWGLFVFVIAHVYIVLLDAQQYRNSLVGAMFTGHKFQKLGEEEERDPHEQR